jgi:hypothetical protein
MTVYNKDRHETKLTKPKKKDFEVHCIQRENGNFPFPKMFLDEIDLLVYVGDFIGCKPESLNIEASIMLLKHHNHTCSIAISGAYTTALNEYNADNQRCEKLYKDDLYKESKELNIKLFNYLYERARESHSGGYYSMEDKLKDEVDNAYEIAKILGVDIKTSEIRK